jgi:protein-arginine kinase activator protein McsA
MDLFAQNLEFEQAAATRDDIAKLRDQQLST